MIMRLQIGKWGNSLAVRLPAALVQKVALREGDILDVRVDADGTLQLSPAQVFDKQAFLATLDKLHHRLPITEPVMDQLRQEQRY